jgi:two-component system sensor histidine kinase KdpD
LTGFTAEDVASSQAPYPWWPEERRQEYLAELSVVRAGKRHKSDWLFRTREGKDFWIKANVTPVKENGRIVYLLANWVDITEYKAAEEKLRKEIEHLGSACREDLDETIQRLRNSLTGLKGYVDSLLASDLEWDRSQRNEFLKEAVAEADYLEGIIEDLAIMNVIESGNLVLDQRVYAVTELLNDAGPRLQALAKNHKLSIIVAPYLPDIFIDEVRVIQALADLVDTAARSAPAGSVITVEVGRASEGVNIDVKSDNPGSSLQSAEETGLAWRLARGIITAHGGRIEIDVNPVKGRRVSLTLPGAGAA